MSLKSLDHEMRSVTKFLLVCLLLKMIDITDCFRLELS